MSDKEWFEGLGAGDALEIATLREPSFGDSTASYVEVNGQFFCHGIEDVIREPKEGRPAEWDADALERWVRGWKIPGVTAIPSGRYPVGIDLSAKFKRRMIAISNVPGYSGVRAHSGLTPAHSEGCQLLGDELYQVDAGWRVRDGKSKPAELRLFGLIEEALERELGVWWTFKMNPRAV